MENFVSVGAIQAIWVSDSIMPNALRNGLTNSKSWIQFLDYPTIGPFFALFVHIFIWIGINNVLVLLKI
jgi:hypothetical protein